MCRCFAFQQERARAQGPPMLTCHICICDPPARDFSVLASSRPQAGLHNPDLQRARRDLCDSRCLSVLRCVGAAVELPAAVDPARAGLVSRGHHVLAGGAGGPFREFLRARTCKVQLYGTGQQLDTPTSARQGPTPPTPRGCRTHLTLSIPATPLPSSLLTLPLNTSAALPACVHSHALHPTYSRP